MASNIDILTDIAGNRAKLDALLEDLNKIAVFKSQDKDGNIIKVPKKSPITGENMTKFEVLLEENKKREDDEIRARTFLWQALFVLSGKDKTVVKGSDIKIQYGYPPAFYRGKAGGWTADERFPIITETMIEQIHSYLTPKRFVEQMIDNVSQGIEIVDFDYSATLNMNVHYHKDNEKQLLFNVNQDFNPGYSLERFRVNLANVMWKKMWVMRTIEATIPKFENLGLPLQVRQFTNVGKGLFLVVGPTGSGKTTTLASLVDIINETQNKNIITIEDPIEYVYVNKKSFISQREVHKDTASFASGTRAALREKPDIVYVGEMRDLETTRAAIELAETGHLCIATLHTFNAAKTIDRIIQQFPTEEQNLIQQSLAGALVGIVSQSLVPTLPDSQGKTGITPLNEVVFINTAARQNIKDNEIDQIIQSVSGEARSLTMADHAKLLSIKTNKVDPYILLEKFFYNDKNTYDTFKDMLIKNGIYNSMLDPAERMERERQVVNDAVASGEDPMMAVKRFNEELEEIKKQGENRLRID